MTLLHKSKTKRYSVELPVDFIHVLNSHLKDTFANKTKWFLEALNSKMNHEKKQLTEKVTNVTND